jgi:hypothetical protein|uniref:Uncharacterized protein n=1 Tax=Zea mays TaxID=4577 RepID=C0HDW0_MAIZE|nr:unknown [Zea mays]
MVSSLPAAHRAPSHGRCPSLELAPALCPAPSLLAVPIPLQWSSSSVRARPSSARFQLGRACRPLPLLLQQVSAPLFFFSIVAHLSVAAPRCRTSSGSPAPSAPVWCLIKCSSGVLCHGQLY